VENRTLRTATRWLASSPATPGMHRAKSPSKSWWDHDRVARRLSLRWSRQIALAQQLRDQRPGWTRHISGSWAFGMGQRKDGARCSDRLGRGSAAVISKVLPAHGKLPPSILWAQARAPCCLLTPTISSGNHSRRNRLAVAVQPLWHARRSDLSRVCRPRRRWTL